MRKGSKDIIHKWRNGGTLTKGKRRTEKEKGNRTLGKP